jgi:hypothetical protein
MYAIAIEKARTYSKYLLFGQISTYRYSTVILKKLWNNYSNHKIPENL